MQLNDCFFSSYETKSIFFQGIIISLEGGAFLSENTMMERFNISYERYMMFFGYMNQFGIFHPEDGVYDYSNSCQYRLVYVSEYNSDTPSDVLKDISFLIRAGKIDLKVNDVISVKMNGFTSSYRFCGLLQKENDFISAPDFLAKEREYYIKQIHDQNMVLSVLDAKIIPMNKLNFEKNKIYCIDKETYSLSSRSGSVISNYSLLMLNNNVITNVNPSGRPFVMIANALYCFMRKMEKEKETLLLLDRHEFELIRDFNDLNNVELVI